MENFHDNLSKESHWLDAFPVYKGARTVFTENINCTLGLIRKILCPSHVFKKTPQNLVIRVTFFSTELQRNVPRFTTRIEISMATFSFSITAVVWFRVYACFPALNTQLRKSLKPL